MSNANVVLADRVSWPRLLVEQVPRDPGEAAEHPGVHPRAALASGALPRRHVPRAGVAGTEQL